MNFFLKANLSKMNKVFGFLGIILIGVIVVLLIRNNSLKDNFSEYRQQIINLEQTSATYEIEKNVLLKEIAVLKDSLAKDKVKIEYIYIELEEVEEFVAEIEPEDSYEDLNEIFPEKDSTAQVYPFSGVQVQGIHLAVVEGAIYADLATQLQKSLNTSTDIIDLQNEALMIADKITATERLKSEILQEQLNTAERKLKNRNTMSAILGGAVGIELLVILIILI